MGSMTDRLTAREVAQALRIHEETLRRWCRTGKIGTGDFMLSDAQIVLLLSQDGTREAMLQAAYRLNSGAMRGFIAQRPLE